MKIARKHFSTTDSTMKIASQHMDNLDLLMVSASEQTSGRGTRGRIWLRGEGNIYVTIAIRSGILSRQALPLLPLQAGLSVRNVLLPVISRQYHRELKIKWPNDLLIENRKISGILIESQNNCVLVGMGINFKVAPRVTDSIVKAACVAEYGIASAQNYEKILNGLLEEFHGFILNQKNFSPTQLIDQIKSNMHWSRFYRLRDREGHPQVFLKDLNENGYLLVQHNSGMTEWLVSDYLE